MSPGLKMIPSSPPPPSSSRYPPTFSHRRLIFSAKGEKTRTDDSELSARKKRDRQAFSLFSWLHLGPSGGLGWKRRGREEEERKKGAPGSSFFFCSFFPTFSTSFSFPLMGGSILTPGGEQTSSSSSSPPLSSLIRNHFRRRILNFKRADRTDGQAGMQQRRRGGKGWQSSMITQAPIGTKSTRTERMKLWRRGRTRLARGEGRVRFFFPLFLLGPKACWLEGECVT